MVVLSKSMLLYFNAPQEAKYGIKNVNTGKTTRMCFTLESQVHSIISNFRLPGKFSKNLGVGDSHKTGEEHHWEDLILVSFS